MELDDINRAHAAQQATPKKATEEIEKADELDMVKHVHDEIDNEAEKRFVRKLDLWYAINDRR